jgi:uncharacterized protein (TIGR00255 family)
MTGFGEARERCGDVLCRVELRSVNNRHFKLSLRCPDGLLQFETELEYLLRESISRGSVSMAIRFERTGNSLAPKVSSVALADYWQQVQQICLDLGAAAPDIGSLLTLPGVLEDGELDSTSARQIWPSVEKAVRAAAVHLGEFRRREGSSMADELRAQCSLIASHVDRIAEQAPQVVVEYRDKLLQRVNDLVKDLDSRLGPSDVLREVALFTDRCDITEEITRLRSHLSQFLKLLEDPTSQGRKLDFMCQELFREVNTIGSKANQIGISHTAVDVKVCVERMRELVQNVE